MERETEECGLGKMVCGYSEAMVLMKNGSETKKQQ